MSRCENHNFRLWEVFGAQLRSTTLHHSMTKLSTGDQRTSADAILAWCMIVTDLYTTYLSKDLSVGSNRHDNFLHSVIECLENHCLDEFIDLMKRADDCLLSVSFRNSDDPDTSFKQMVSRFPKGYGWLRNLLLYGFHGSEPFSTHFACAHQIFSFLTRITLVVPSLEKVGLEGWISTQERIPTGLDYSPLVAVVRRWFSSLVIEDLRPRNGSGASYCSSLGVTTRVPAEKYIHSEWTPLMRYIEKYSEFAGLSHPFGYKTDGETPSKLKFVPKSYAKVRSIAIEPPAKMWYQQAGMDLLDQHFLSHPYLRRRISLHNSSRNCRLAREGSVDGHLSTIDLSNASDSVSWECVKHMFIGSSLYPLLVAARTRSVSLPSGELYALKSHATMGSAFCFPIECVVFAAICEHAIKSAGADPRRSCYSVYGDDIVVETCYAQSVLDHLEYYGFVVNPEKSYTDLSKRNFRESCGGEYIDGVDVAPLRISRKFSGFGNGVLTSHQFETLIDLSNRSFCRFPTLRSYCLKRLLRLPQTLRPVFGDEGSNLLLSYTATNYHLKRHLKLSSDYQRRVLVHGVSRSDSLDSPSEWEPIRLYDWFIRSRSERPSDWGVVVPVTAVVSEPQVPLLRQSFT